MYKKMAFIRVFYKLFLLQALRNLINITLKLDSSEVEVEKNSSSAFIYFRSYEARNKAIKKLNGFKWNGKTLEAIVGYFFQKHLVNFDVLES